MTAQEIFDRVVARLRDGTGRANIVVRGGNERCCYLTPDGRKCAVGIFIPDGDRAQTLAAPVDELLEIYSSRQWAQSLAPHVDLLGEVQEIHDDSRNWYGGIFTPFGEAALEYIADHYSLTLPSKQEA